ncbi:MAG: hypothetical protein A2Z14_06465 [Chloroflexi bacterium RBG_16_48_8]|nr:MAG: hypothetical protein A2Z14_06465 [Chloroflexi bacterium RBG_16_48_8]
MIHDLKVPKKDELNSQTHPFQCSNAYPEDPDSLPPGGYAYIAPSSSGFESGERFWFIRQAQPFF